MADEKEITDESVTSVDKAQNPYSSASTVNMDQQGADTKLDIVIHHKDGDKYIMPAVKEGVSWDTYWKGSPGKLTFSCMNDKEFICAEGDVVQASYGGQNFFYGFVFSQKYDRNGFVSITAYDQIRYLKNKVVYNFKNKTAGDIIKQICEDLQMQIGTLAPTSYVIPKKHCGNEAAIDIVQDVINLTTENETDSSGKKTYKLYVFYDDFGKLMLKPLEEMETNVLIDAETAQDYSFESSIDKDTYNQVKLYYDNKETGKREVWLVYDSANIKRWGVLQLVESVDAKKPINFKQMADMKLKLHNRIRRSLQIKNAFGSLKVRGGSMIVCDLDLGDGNGKLTKQLIVDSVTHRFSNGSHLMDLVLKGDIITG